jgi:cytochrome c oxidase subunit 3
MSEHKHGDVHYVDSGIPQPWHLVRPSIWPLIGAKAAGLMMAGAVVFMHKDKISFGGMSIEFGWVTPFIGFVGVLAVMFFWWRDIVHEAVVEKAHSPQVGIGLRYGMILFIASEVVWRFSRQLFLAAFGRLPTSKLFMCSICRS